MAQKKNRLSAKPSPKSAVDAIPAYDSHLLAAGALVIALILSVQTYRMSEQADTAAAQARYADRALTASRSAHETAKKKIKALEEQLPEQVDRMATQLRKERAPLMADRPTRGEVTTLVKEHDRSAEVAQLTATLKATQSALTVTRSTVDALQSQLTDARKSLAGTASKDDLVTSRQALVNQIDGVRKAMRTLADRSELEPLARKTDLDGLARRSELKDVARKGDLKDVARKGDLTPLARKSELKDVARKSDLKDVARKGDLKDVARKGDLTPLARKSELKDVARKGDLKDVVRKSELAALAAERRKLETRIAKLTKQLEGAKDARQAMASKKQLQTVLVGLVVQLWALEERVKTKLATLNSQGGTKD